MKIIHDKRSLQTGEYTMVYLLCHKRQIEDDVYDEKFIGIYSSYDNAISTKNEYLSICGFEDYAEGFFIDSLEIEGKRKIKKEQSYVYYVSYHNPKDEYEATVKIGVFYTRLEAIIGVLKYSIKTGTRIPCTRDYLEKAFYIDKYYFDKNEWTEGFGMDELEMEEIKRLFGKKNISDF